MLRGAPQLFSKSKGVPPCFTAAPLCVGRGAGFLTVERFKEGRTPGNFQRYTEGKGIVFRVLIVFPPNGARVVLYVKGNN